MRFYKQTRWFEAYFETEENRILDRFFDHLRVGDDHQFWLGRCYLTVRFYGRKTTVSGPDAVTP